MADLVFNSRKADFGYYCGLPAASDALIVVLLESAGLQADATLRDYTTLADVLAANTEQTTMGRKTVTTGVTVTVDQTNDRVDVDMPDLLWTAAAGNATGALLICYDAATGSGTDADILVLTKHDFVATPGGGDITAQIASAGFARAS